ncbi:hypothetical protein SLEP1_g57722 [Rubroshorea leprosula]|uniref:Protein FAR1-RELATED SEQUENCE n=1 Tax=Rubroshorea leprosula TaxID=152421 RepID=A0AAV5MM98_9ROSI|nr:hypothetical protein SLEP1_g57722 [Rubroshorea leprosula]
MEVELNPTSEKACEIVALETPSEDGLAEPEDEERIVPAAGMVFDSVNSALEFYKGYGKRMGFGVSTRNSTLSPDGTYKRKAGCKAKMALVQTLDGDGSYAEYGGYENMGFSERDCRNYLDQQRRLRIIEGDGEAVRRYFEVMKFQSPNFYSRIEVDSERRVTNLFWANGRTRATYEYFNDVVAFDTTYLMNRVIRKAVQIVFPATRHHWCMWHIRQKLPQKLAAVQRYRELENTFSSLIYHCNDRNEFEQKWQVMIEEHDLVENQWLKDIFEEHEMWAPPFLTYHFWAGISSTQRSEGLNAFFDGFVHGQTTLNTFVEQYALAQRRKMEKEAKANLQSYKSVVQCVTKLHYKKQFQAAYMQAKFIEIQEELKDMLGIFPEVVEEEGQCKIFQREEGNGGMERVTFHAEKIEFTCTCRCFQFRGIVCRHAFVVLLQQRVKKVNSIYILDRWRKDIT